MVTDVIDELLQLATSQGCSFPSDFKKSTIARMTEVTDTHSIMYQDYTAKRPMEVETYLGSPIKLAAESGVRVPRIETLYALLHHCNIVNQQRPAPSSSPNGVVGGPAPPPARTSSTAPPPRHTMNGVNGMNGTNGINGVNGGINGNGPRGGRTSSIGGPPMRRGGGPPNGYPRQNGYPPNQLSRRPSFEGDDLGDVSHLVLYDDIPEGGPVAGYGKALPDLALRERELALRQRELQLREQELSMRRGSRRPPPSQAGFDDDDDDDYFDPMSGPPIANVDPDNVDMMSITSKRNRRMPSHGQIRRNPEQAMMGRPGGMRQSFGRPFGGSGRNRSSAQLVDNSMPTMHEDLLSNPMMGYSSNRYGNVDRREMATESRTNSLTASRLSELQGAGNNPGMNGAYPMPRRQSQSPGNPFRNVGRPSPPEHEYPMNGGPMNGGPMNGGPMNGGPMNGGQMNGGLMNGGPNGTPIGGPMNGAQMNGGPPLGMRQPVPRHPPGQGSTVAMHQVDTGVSTAYPSKGPVQKQVRSLTGSASASAGSGDSAPADSDPSAHSSQSSLAPRFNNARYPPRHAVGV